MIVASLSIHFLIPHRKVEAEGGVMLRVSPQYLRFLLFKKKVYLFDCSRSYLWHVGSSFLTMGRTPALGGWSLGRWTTREVPPRYLLFFFIIVGFVIHWNESAMDKSFSPPDCTIVIKENHLGLRFRQIINCFPGSYAKFSKINE